MISKLWKLLIVFVSGVTGNLIMTMDSIWSLIIGALIFGTILSVWDYLEWKDVNE